MLGLFGTLNLGARSLQTQQMGVEVAGHNLANVNNPNYSRQRVQIESSLAIPVSPIGVQGTGADVVAIRQIRDQILDDQITSEVSLSGSLASAQKALQYAQANLGQRIDRHSAGANAAASATSLSGEFGVAEGINALFNSFQSIAVSPRDTTERTVLLENAKALSAKFQQTDARLGRLRTTLDDSLRADVSEANLLLTDIALLNNEIANAEIRNGGAANDLRDKRQTKLEELAKLANVTVTRDSDGVLSVAVGTTTMVSGKNVLETFQAYDAGGGQILVRGATSGSPLSLTSGSMHGTISTRDGSIATLRSDLNALAALVISEVNAVHSTGFSLTGATGANFFTGTDASNMGVNTALTTNPQLVQASGVAANAGDNQVALQMAQLADKRHAGLADQTFSQYFNRVVSNLGQSLANTNGQAETQQVVEDMLLRQRDSLMGVSIDEEMSDLIRFQKAYQASARIITTVDEMLETVLTLKR
ncbi:MAG: flagellar hook-associated protein FlgK [Verrucomicrobia bacterium]|nr:flagellar hook-associated protein FlgK [Verrucomicrobiota bacterium]